MDKKTKIKWVAIVTTIILVSMAIGIGIGYGIKGAQNGESLFGQPDMLSYSIFDDEHLQLKLSPLAAGDSSSYTRTITATVLPEDAPVKTVRWWVTWDAASDITFEDTTVTHYVTVTPNSEGSATATIQCLKPFEGANIIITCKTDVGGYIATCVVKYVGTPNSLSYDTTGKTIKTFDGWGVSGVEVSCNTTTYIPIQLDNAMHAVGSGFGTYSISGVAHGGITWHSVFTGNYGQGTTESDGSSTITESHMDTLYDQPVVGERFYIAREGNGQYLYLMDVFVEDGQLKIEAKDSFSAYSYHGGDRSGTIDRTFTGYIDGKKPYFEITVTEVNSGVSQKINITTQATVSSLSLSLTNIEF